LGALRGAIGTPDQIRDLVRRYEEAGVDQLIFVSQAGRNRHEDICESLELFAEQVMPEFAGRADDLEATKSERLAEASAAALVRRPAARTLEEGFNVPVVPGF
jgi:isopentenyl diphosphate isomerase/L-lactate dehydrogenase-like FMN-dependent dehydrogenase